MRLLFLPLCMVIGAGTAHATPPVLEDLDRLDAGIALALGGGPDDAGKRAQPVDRRLRMVRCPEGLAYDAATPGAVLVSCASKGWRLRVPLIINAAPPTDIVIRRGDSVQIAYLGSGFDVSTTATALEDGREGGFVRVKLPTATAPLTARVRAPGEVEIGN